MIEVRIDKISVLIRRDRSHAPANVSTTMSSHLNLSNFPQTAERGTHGSGGWGAVTMPVSIPTQAGSIEQFSVLRETYETT